MELFVLIVVADSIDVCEIQSCSVDRFVANEAFSYELVVALQFCERFLYVVLVTLVFRVNGRVMFRWLEYGVILCWVS